MHKFDDLVVFYQYKICITGTNFWFQNKITIMKLSCMPFPSGLVYSNLNLSKFSVYISTCTWCKYEFINKNSFCFMTCTCLIYTSILSFFLNMQSIHWLQADLQNKLFICCSKKYESFFLGYMKQKTSIMKYIVKNSHRKQTCVSNNLLLKWAQKSKKIR